MLDRLLETRRPAIEAISGAPAYVAFDMMTRVFSPYNLAVGMPNPLTKILLVSIDFTRLAAISADTLDGLPHNGAVVTLLLVCGSPHTKSYFDIDIVGIIGALLALAAVIGLGGLLGSL